jgi:hypothetical protein
LRISNCKCAGSTLKKESQTLTSGRAPRLHGEVQLLISRCRGSNPAASTSPERCLVVGANVGMQDGKASAAAIHSKKPTVSCTIDAAEEPARGTTGLGLGGTPADSREGDAASLS